MIVVALVAIVLTVAIRRPPPHAVRATSFVAVDGRGKILASIGYCRPEEFLDFLDRAQRAYR